MTPTRQVRRIFHTLYRAWGAQHWWPAHSAFEVIVGAYLTQNTAWTNVEKAIANLRSANALSIDAIRAIPIDDLAALIRSAGYFRQKAARLKNFVAWLDQTYQGSLEQMFSAPTDLLRSQLLSLNGVGPETADSILLYAGSHDVFVVDAYTRRIFARHAITPFQVSYDVIRLLVENALREEELPLLDTEFSGAPIANPAHEPSVASQLARSQRAQVLNEMHAVIVGVAKLYCLKSQPRCDVCPLRKLLPMGGPLSLPSGSTAKPINSEGKN